MEHDADPERLLELIGASWTTQVIRVAAELGVADALASGPRPVTDLAAEVGAHESSLRRLVRALVALDLCTDAAGDRVAMTPTGALLASGDGSLRSWARWWGGPSWVEWGDLLDAVRTGRPVRPGDGFADAGADPEGAAMFDDAMASLSALEAPTVVAALQLRGDELVVDLGGGSGMLVRAVVDRHPEARAMVVDLPGAVASARARFAAWGVEDRCEAVVGDLFGELPPGGDAYVLKSVLHDWDDDDARRILVRCVAAAGPDARIEVVERLVPERSERTAAARSTARMDLHMLIAQGGRERTEAELRSLLASAGLTVVEVRPAGSVAVIEAVQADR
ncbi:methyltransferase [Aquihabitans daechungensis]|uniref:methyltransferase n=1 Tax=Aquihabitans daechungensis TaxID=1052257 RepID=UPI003BA25ED3